MSREKVSVTYNFMTNSVGVDVEASSTHEGSSTNVPGTVTFDELYLRTRNALIHGSQVVARLVDAVVTENVRIESLLDTFHLDHEEFSASLGFGVGPKPGMGLPDVRWSDRHIAEEAVKTVARLAGTERFLLTAGGQLHLLSGDVGLRPDGTLLKLSEADRAALKDRGVQADTVRIKLLPETSTGHDFYINAPLGSVKTLWDTATALKQEYKTAAFEKRVIVNLELFDRLLGIKVVVYWDAESLFIRPS